MKLRRSDYYKDYGVVLPYDYAVAIMSPIYTEGIFIHNWSSSSPQTCTKVWGKTTQKKNEDHEG